MPRVPVYDGPKVAQAPIPGARVPAERDPAEFGAGIGRGLQQAGTMALQLHEQEKRKADAVVGLNGINQYWEAANTLVHDPTSGALRQEGQNAIGIADRTLMALDKRGAEIAFTMKNDAQRLMFRRARDAKRYEVFELLQRHEADQYNQIDRSETEKALVNFDRDATADYRNPAAVVNALDRKRATYTDYARRHGRGEQEMAATLSELTSQTHVDVTKSFVAADDYAGATAYLKEHGDAIRLEERLSLQGALKTKQASDRSDLRLTISERYQDLQAMAARGEVLPRKYIQAEEVDRAFADQPTRAAEIKRDLKETYQLANDSRRLLELPNDQLTALVQSRAPSPSDPQSYAEDAARQEQLGKIAHTILTQRIKEPIQYAAEHGIGFIEPLDLSNPKVMAQRLAAREETARIMQDRFGSPLALLTTPEASALARVIEEAPTATILSYLHAIRQGVTKPDAYHALMQQIRPDSPVTAFAGGLLQRQDQRVRLRDRWLGADEWMGAQDVASRIIDGEKLLNPTKGDKATDGKPKFALPSDTDLRLQWADYVGDAYRGAPEVEQTAYQAFRAYYAAEASRRGQYVGILDTGITKSAARAVSGGILDVNGRNVVLPWGMDRDTFTEKLRTAWPGVLRAYRLPASVPLDRVGLDTVGDGRYAVTAGDGPLYAADGRLVVVEVHP
jgi:hypothetical protein